MYFFYKDYKVSYYISGSNDWLVLLHGWKMNSESFKDVISRLEKKYKVLSIDLLGFGNSDVPNDSLTIDDYLDMIEKLLDNLGVINPIILGHSFGGKLAILYALRRKVKKLILVSPSGIKHFSFKTFLKIRIYKIKKIFYRLLKKDLKKLQSKYGSSDYIDLAPAMKKTMSNIIKVYVDSELKKLTSPVLLLWGYYDKITPYKDTKKFMKNVKNIKLVTFQRSGHFCYIDEVDKFVYSILREDKV